MASIKKRLNGDLIGNALLNELQNELIALKKFLNDAEQDK